jgi:hypothetical protein
MDETLQKSNCRLVRPLAGTSLAVFFSLAHRSFARSRWPSCQRRSWYRAVGPRVVLTNGMTIELTIFND